MGHSSSCPARLAGGTAPPRRFGDLDTRGLQIPVRAALTARTAGLPDVTPSAPLYRMLLEQGRPQPGRPVDATTAADLAAWLPEPLRAPTTTLLPSGHRLAQEWIGYQTLRDG